MDEQIRITMLLDADRCAVNQELQKVRSKMTLADLEREYLQWWDSLS